MSEDEFRKEEIIVDFGRFEGNISTEEIYKLITKTGRNYGGHLLTIDPKTVIEEFEKLKRIQREGGVSIQALLVTQGATCMFEFITGNSKISPSMLMTVVTSTIQMIKKGYPELDVMEFMYQKFFGKKGGMKDEGKKGNDPFRGP